jgi:hypothetical protein
LAQSQALKVSYVIQHNLEKMHPRPARGSLKGKKHETENRLIFTDGSTAVSTLMLINQY